MSAHLDDAMSELLEITAGGGTKRGGAASSASKHKPRKSTAASA
jgi:hypothetical protein